MVIDSQATKLMLKNSANMRLRILVGVLDVITRMPLLKLVHLSIDEVSFHR